MIDLHRIPESYIPVNRGSRYAPPQRIPRVDEVESRGWGRRAPQSPSSSSFGAPQGNNKIYRSDEVFLMEESKKSDPSQTLIPYKKSKEISRLQVKQAVPQAQPKPHGSVLDAKASSYLPRSIRRLQVKAPNKFGYRTSSVSLSPGNDAHMIKSS